MTVTATADTSRVPFIGITITSPDGTPMTAITLYRNTGAVQTLTRVQPLPGVAARYLADYEAPWGTLITYTAQITYGSGATATMNSPAVTLTPAGCWAIHPTIPSISVQLDVGDTKVMGIVSIDPVTRAAQVTKHTIIGSAYPIVTKTGNRDSSTGTLTVATVTTDEETALATVLNDQTPLLIRVPASWGWNWEDGYYAVGDVTNTRFYQFGPEQRRVFTLPYQRVQPPAGEQQSVWDYPSLNAAFADYPSMSAAYRDYAALTGNVR